MRKFLPRRSKHHTNGRFIIVTLLSVILLMVVSCSVDQTANLFSKSCEDIGNRPANAPESSPTEVLVLIDVSSNDEHTADRIAQDMGSVLGPLLSNHDDIILTGLTAGGTESSIVQIVCMQSQQYFFAGGNERRQTAERGDLVNLISEEMKSAVQATNVAETGDARVLLRQVPTIKQQSSPHVILYSSFLAQGTDCLAFEQGDSPTLELASKVVARCVDEGLLPSLGDASLTIVGAGSSPDRPELSTFGKSLASELCTHIARECDVK